MRTRTFILVLFIFTITIACVVAVLVPAGWMIWGEDENVWNDSKIISLIAIFICAAIASVPLLSAATWRWYAPFGFGVVVTIWTLMLLMVFFLLRADSSMPFGFYPHWIAAQATGGILLLVEGLLAKLKKV